MKAILVFLIVIALLLLLALIPIKFFIRYQEDQAVVRLGVLFFRYTLFPAKEKKEKKPSNTTASKAKKSAEKQSKPSEKTDWKGTLSALLDLLQAALPPVGFLLRYLHLERLRLRIIVGGEEPDETAIQYGRLNAAIYGGLATLRNLIHVQVDRLTIAVDFTRPDTQVDFSATLKIRFGVVAVAAVRLAWRYLICQFRKDQAPAASTVA